MEQYLQRAETNDGGASFENLKKSMSSTLDESDANPSVGFDCNICLDLVQDPVVTFCGHLYCWPCIYRWISFRDNDPDFQSHPQCPVCKAEVSEKTLIPLYGRGHSSKRKLSHFVPHRPSSPRCNDNVLLPNSPSYPFQQREDHAGGYRVNHLADPMIGMFGEMVYARIFGNSETTLYAYPNSYRLVGSNTPRLRRYMMQTDKSLSRVCFFFFCCMILCLLLF